MSLSPLLFVLLIPIAMKVLQSHDPVPPTASLWRQFVTRQRADLSQVFEERGKRKDSRYNMLFASTHFSVAKCYKKLCPLVCPLSVLKKIPTKFKEIQRKSRTFCIYLSGVGLVFRCVHASLYEGLSVCPWVGPSVHMLVAHFFNRGIGVRTA